MAERQNKIIVEWLDINLEQLSVAEKKQLISEILETLPGEELLTVEKSVETMRLARLEEMENAILTELEEKVARAGLTMRDVLTKLRRQARADKGATLKPKYVSPTGDTWSGRGFPPTWLKNLEAQGHRREEYLVQETEEGV